MIAQFYASRTHLGTNIAFLPPACALDYAVPPPCVFLQSLQFLSPSLVPISRGPSCSPILPPHPPPSSPLLLPLSLLPPASSTVEISPSLAACQLQRVGLEGGHTPVFSALNYDAAEASAWGEGP